MKTCISCKTCFTLHWKLACDLREEDAETRRTNEKYRFNCNMQKYECKGEKESLKHLH